MVAAAGRKSCAWQLAPRSKANCNNTNANLNFLLKIQRNCGIFSEHDDLLLKNGRLLLQSEVLIAGAVQ